MLRWEGPGIGKQVIAGRFFSPLAVCAGDYGGDDNFHTKVTRPSSTPVIPLRRLALNRRPTAAA